eukprot:gene36654-49398_t
MPPAPASSRTDGSRVPTGNSPQAMPYSMRPCNCVRRGTGRSRPVNLGRQAGSCATAPATRTLEYSSGDMGAVMNMLVKAALSAALLVGTSYSALAVERGGTLKYGRYADSLFLDPVLNDANVDIWVLSNLYDTLILPTDDGKGLKPGLATEWKVSPDGLTVTLTLRDGI